jgi:hypothetical protein
LALSVPLSRFTSRVGGGSAFYVRPQDCVMRIFPTSKEWLVWLRRAAAFAAGFAVWRVCFYVSSQASAQTGYPPSVDHQMYCEAFRWLWFPFSWIPMPQPLLIGAWQQSLRLQLIGVPYGVIVGLVILWLFRTSPPKKT